MLQIDSLLLEDFYTETKDFLTNARVQKIQQPTRREIIMFVRNKFESKKLYININPSFHHICFMSKDNESKRHIDIPVKPPMFCMLLRKHLEGAKIVKVNKPDFERIIEIIFENYNEIGEKVEECLSIELMGKHSNIVLYNTDNNIIIGCAHNVSEQKSKERELSGGLPYIYPPKQHKKDLRKTKFNSFESALKKSEDSIKKTIADKYFSISQVLAQEICKSKNIDSEKTPAALTTEMTQVLFIAFHEFLEQKQRKYYVNDDFSQYSSIEKYTKEYFQANLMIDDYFAINTEKELIKDLKNRLKTIVNKELKKLKATYANQQKQTDNFEKIETYKLKGNLLTSNAYKLKQGLTSIELTDYCTKDCIKIELDENKTPIENAQNYFRLYNKAKKAFQIASEMSAKTLEEIDYNKQLLFDIEISSKYEELKNIEEEIVPQKEIKKKNVKNDISIEQTDVDGYFVYIGKNNKQNDYIYSKISSPNDIWFHTLNTPGSHIIVKTDQSNKDLTDETILKIAKLSKKYSTAKNSTKVAVVYTKRKYIKRPNNTKSGFVVYKNETEIVID